MTEQSERGSVDPAVLVVGSDEQQAEALADALEKQGAFPETALPDAVQSAVVAASPDLVVLYAKDVVPAVVKGLAHAARALPVVMLGGQTAQQELRLRAFPPGTAVAMADSGGMDAIAKRVTELARQAVAAGGKLPVEALQAAGGAADVARGSRRPRRKESVPPPLPARRPGARPSQPPAKPASRPPAVAAPSPVAPPPSSRPERPVEAAALVPPPLPPDLVAPLPPDASPAPSPVAPEASPAAPEASPAAPEASPAAPEASPAAPEASTAVPEVSPAAPPTFSPPLVVAPELMAPLGKLTPRRKRLLGAAAAAIVGAVVLAVVVGPRLCGSSSGSGEGALKRATLSAAGGSAVAAGNARLVAELARLEAAKEKTVTEAQRQAPRCADLLRGRPAPLPPAEGGPTPQWQLLRAGQLVLAWDHDGAARAYCEGIAANPEFVGLRIGRVQQLLLLSDAKAAAEVAREGLKAFPDEPQLAFLLGDALAHMGDWAEARKAWMQAGKVDPNDAEAVERLATRQINAAREALRRQKHEEAKRMFRRAAVLNLKGVEATTGMAQMLLTLKDAQAAVGWARRAVELEPSAAAQHVMLGRALAAAGDTAGAEAAFRKALEFNAGEPEALRRLGQLQQQR